jgi:hypothetical protein
MEGHKGKIWIIAFAVIAVILVILAIGPLIVRKVTKGIDTAILKGKSAHSATATVIRKEYVRFDEKNRVYVNEDGVLVERRAGDEEWRVYYQINKFDGVEQATIVKLLEAEEERKAKGRLRFTILSKEQYDNIQEGEELSVSWRLLGKNEIEIISAGKPVTTYIRK